MKPDHWTAPPDRRNFAAALGVGLLIEVAAVALLLPTLNRPQPPAEIKAPVRLTIQVPAPPKPPAPKPPPPQPQPQPKPPPPQPKPPLPPPPKPVPMPLPPPPPVPAPRPRPYPVHRVIHHPPVTPPPRPVPVTPPPPPAPAPPSAGQVDLFRAAIRRAVEQVANSVYPPTGREAGQVSITIDYLNGREISVRLAQSSGFPVLDEAALKAGRIAHYPPPPPAFANHVYSCTIKIIFRPAAPSFDAD